MLSRQDNTDRNNANNDDAENDEDNEDDRGGKNNDDDEDREDEDEDDGGEDNEDNDYMVPVAFEESERLRPSSVVTSGPAQDCGQSAPTPLAAEAPTAKRTDHQRVMVRLQGSHGL